MYQQSLPTRKQATMPHRASFALISFASNKSCLTWPVPQDGPAFLCRCRTVTGPVPESRRQTFRRAAPYETCTEKALHEALKCSRPVAVLGNRSTLPHVRQDRDESTVCHVHGAPPCEASCPSSALTARHATQELTLLFLAFHQHSTNQRCINTTPHRTCGLWLRHPDPYLDTDPNLTLTLPCP